MPYLKEVLQNQEFVSASATEAHPPFACGVMTLLRVHAWKSRRTSGRRSASDRSASLWA